MIKLSASTDEKILGSLVEILMSWCIIYVSHFPKKAVGEGWLTFLGIFFGKGKLKFKFPAVKHVESLCNQCVIILTHPRNSKNNKILHNHQRCNFINNLIEFRMQNTPSDSYGGWC